MNCLDSDRRDLQHKKKKKKEAMSIDGSSVSSCTGKGTVGDVSRVRGCIALLGFPSESESESE